MNRFLRPRGIRSRLFLAVVAGMAAALAILIVAFNVVVARTLSREADDALRARAAAQLDVLKPIGGRLVLAESPDETAVDSQVWVFSGGRTLEAPQTAPGVDRAARRLAGGQSRFLTVPGTDTRLYATSISAGGRRLGTLVAGLSLRPYDQTKRTALLGSLALAALLLAALAVAARWLLASALRPVARMTTEAASWSERDLDRRFALGEPYDELTQLAATLDRLLDRLGASLRREQRFSAELSHELRTPLTKIVAEAELALRRERQPHEYRSALEVVLRSARSLGRTVEALVAAAREEASPARGTADAYGPAARAVEACSELAGQHGIEVVVAKPASPLSVGVSDDLLERILQPVIDNACRYARQRVKVSVARDAGGASYVVEDDGPGVAAEERERIFEPGVRGVAADADGAVSGAGLGLALARRLARSAAGDIEAEPSPSGGRFVVRIPAA